MSGGSVAMSGFFNFNLINFLDFYFSFLFFVGTFRRFQQYQSIGQLVFAGPTRWPRLLKLLGEYRTLFLTWGTVLPAILALILVASRFIWPDAGQPPNGLTVQQLMKHWLALLVVAPLGLGMVLYDCYALLRVSVIDRETTEKYLDQAEYWLGSRNAHVIRVVTFGYINPRKMVAEEVRKALLSVSEMLNASLWWWIRQIILRFSFGLALWLTWALTHGAAPR
jgi:hypothetical protein